MKKVLAVAMLMSIAAVFANNAAVNQSNNANGCSSCSACSKVAKKYIGKAAAIKIALAHAGLERSAVRDLKCEFDREDGVMIYEVEFESGAYDYEYDIDAMSGKILKSKKERD